LLLYLLTLIFLEHLLLRQGLGRRVMLKERPQREPSLVLQACCSNSPRTDIVLQLCSAESVVVTCCGSLLNTPIISLCSPIMSLCTSRPVSVSSFLSPFPTMALNILNVRRRGRKRRGRQWFGGSEIEQEVQVVLAKLLHTVYEAFFCS